MGNAQSLLSKMGNGAIMSRINTKQSNPISIGNLYYGEPRIVRQQTSNHHIVYLYGEIGEAESIVDTINLLDSCEENDVIELHIATVGGQVDTAIALIHAMKRCRGHIVCHADSNVESAGIPIFLSGDSFFVHPFAMFMTHDGSYGMQSKVNEHLKRAMAISELLSILSHDIMYPYFTHEEIDDILDGGDVYIMADEMRGRLVEGVKIIQSESKQETDINEPEETEDQLQLLHEDKKL